MFRVVETFSGIGAQAKALERIGIAHQIVNTCDWDIGAIAALFSQIIEINELIFKNEVSNYEELERRWGNEND